MSFQFEYEKRPPSSNSCDSRATATTDWSRNFPSLPEQGRTSEKRDAYPSERRDAYPETYHGERGAYQSGNEQRGAYQGEQEQRGAYPTHEQRAYQIEQKAYRTGYEGYRTRPLPPRPVCERVPAKSTVPLKVWVIASASCFAVCAALVLATVVITRWGAGQSYTREMIEEQDLIYSNPHAIYITPKPLPANSKTDPEITNAIDNDLNVLEKLSIFKNVLPSREKPKKSEDLISKPQLHPLHDSTIEHLERKIEKKDQAKLPIAQVAESSIKKVIIPFDDFTNVKSLDASPINEIRTPIDFDEVKKPIPDFKPTLPDVFVRSQAEIKLPDGYMLGLRKHDSDYEEYYTDDNFYDDYMQSNTMTSYLIEKVQELHDWITSDPDFESVRNSSKIANKSTEFRQVLKALNQSLVQGNVSIIMGTLKDLYFGENYASSNHSRKLIVSNSTDLLSFGILTLDIMLLHNIQLMAWENQEAARLKMLKDPDVFAFNALFMDPAKVEAKQSEVVHHHDAPATFSKRQNLRQDMDEFDIGKSLLENFLEVGMSTARAAIHLGRAYKNTKAALNQLSNREVSPNIQAQLSRNVEDNAVALNHLERSWDARGDSSHTALDCVWLLYCRNLAAARELRAPYSTMAHINGVALRMLVGDLPTDKALETIAYEAMTGWGELKCDELFPRCSRSNAAAEVMEMILQPVRKTQASRL